MKHKPSFKRFAASLIPRKLPNRKELGRKIDVMMYQLQSKFRFNKAMREDS